jgi:hypothetical protein
MYVNKFQQSKSHKAIFIIEKYLFFYYVIYLIFFSINFSIIRKRNKDYECGRLKRVLYQIKSIVEE